MNKILRLSILGILLVLLVGFLPSAAQAGPSAQVENPQLVQIKNNPRNGGRPVSAGGGRTAYLCNGWRGAQGIIDVPVRNWATSPVYPLVGVPFKIGIGVDLNYLRTQFPSSNITFANQIRFFGYRTEIRLVPNDPSHFYFGWNFNGILDYDDSIAYRNIYSSNEKVMDWGGSELVVPSFYTDPDIAGVPSSHPDSDYYPSVGDENIKDSVIFSGYSSMSSYHAGNPTTYKGEPAFRLEVTSSYKVKARARWDSYQEWEKVIIGERTECRPGPSSTGTYNCINPISVSPWYERGHYVTADIYDYRWGSSVPWNEDSDGLNWVTVRDAEGNPIIINTNKVAWPDGSIHDHIPILIYQAQPILQKP